MMISNPFMMMMTVMYVYHGQSDQQDPFIRIKQEMPLGWSGIWRQQGGHFPGAMINKDLRWICLSLHQGLIEGLMCNIVNKTLVDFRV